MEKLQEEVDLNEKIKDLLAQPYKNRCYAIEKRWVDSFNEYAKSITDLQQYFGQLLAQHVEHDIENGGQSSKQQAQTIKVESEEMLQGVKILRPGPVLNFDLVNLSPVYQQLKEQVLTKGPDDEDSKKVAKFMDWQFMMLNYKHIGALQQFMQHQMNQAMGYDYLDAELGNQSTDQAQEIVLVSQQCWSKITYFYGQVGPDIMFFCTQDPITKTQVPDLEPIRVSVRNLKPDDGVEVKQMILISQHITLSQFTHYLCCNCTHLLNENTSPTKLLLLLVDQNAMDQKQMIT